MGSSQRSTNGTAQVDVHEFSSALVQFSLQSNVYAAIKHSGFPYSLPKFRLGTQINWGRGERVGKGEEKVGPEAGLKLCKPFYNMLQFDV